MKISSVIFLSIVLMALWSGCKSDPCKDVECQNGGVCMDGVCECPDDYEGVSCEYASITSFLGTYKTSYTGCFTVGPDHTVGVAEGEGEAPSVVLIGLGDYECPGNSEIRVTATVSNGGLEIADQTVCQDVSFSGYTFSGQGAKQGDTLIVTFQAQYEVDGAGRTDNCTATLIKE